ncbi:unnamed protein product [Schistocephalus solidus]|uniref:Gag_pre-integrs domain-containing protein n=1 Tax=Schistocephalus solidus TaxID=70667 RepID=A0A183TLC4_SCHSO|nr:unnamed protein product [Schistocephalus solidus]
MPCVQHASVHQWLSGPRQFWLSKPGNHLKADSHLTVLDAPWQLPGLTHLGDVANAAIGRVLIRQPTSSNPFCDSCLQNKHSSQVASHFLSSSTELGQKVHHLEELSTFIEGTSGDNPRFIPSERVPGVYSMHSNLEQTVPPLYCQLMFICACRGGFFLSDHNTRHHMFHMGSCR